MYDFQFPEEATRWDDTIPGVEGNTTYNFLNYQNQEDFN